jgi:thiamine biosynthesis lipoprotein
LGHILDPRTGQPAEGVISATVVAPTAAEADALSTALYVMGADGAIQYCKTKPEIGAVLVGPAAGQPGVRVRLAGITRDELKIVDSSVTIH